MPLPPKGLALAPQTQKSSKTIQNHPKPQNFGDLSVSFCLLVLVFHWTLWQFGRRGAPPDSVALQGSWHSARMATALAAAGGWASAMLRHGVTPNRFFHTNINAICNMIYTYIHAYTCKAIYIPIYICDVCVCTTCISKYIKILQITAATATLCL